MATKAKKQATVVPDAFAGGKMINLDDLHPRPNNGRQRYDEKKMKELAASIKARGVVEPLLVRPRPEGGYEVVAGERRRRAAKTAKLEEVPCWVEEMDDATAAIKGAIENLQREDLDPIEEAAEFAALLEQTKSIKELSRQLGKTDIKYITRRLPLAELIDEVAENLRAGHISLGHALEIARLPKHVQLEALKACFDYDYDDNYDGEDTPDKVLELTVDGLRNWIAHSLLLDLARAPFKLDDDRLHADGLTCLKCPTHTGANATLFEGLGDGEKDSCLNRACFAGKTMAFVKLEAVRIKKKGAEEPAPVISNYYNGAPEGMLNTTQFYVQRKTDERCEHAERAVWGQGPELAKTAWICRSPECPKHLGRGSGVVSSRSAVSNGYHTSSEAQDVRKADRKQELFDIKVNEAARRRVFKEALPTYEFPLPREMRNRVAYSFFDRLPGHHQKTIEAVLGHDMITEDLVAGMDEQQLAAFQMFCTFSHLGANEYGYSRAHQRDVVALAADRGVNYALIDAETRLELSPKKYKKEHQTYLDEVTAGTATTPPNVYGGEPVALPSAGDNDNDRDVRNLDGDEEEDGEGDEED